MTKPAVGNVADLIARNSIPAAMKALEAWPELAREATARVLDQFLARGGDPNLPCNLDYPGTITEQIHRTVEQRERTDKSDRPGDQPFAAHLAS